MPADGPGACSQVQGCIPAPVEPSRFRLAPADWEGERYEPDLEMGPILARMYRRYVAGNGSTSHPQMDQRHGDQIEPQLHLDGPASVQRPRLGIRRRAAPHPRPPSANADGPPVPACRSTPVGADQLWLGQAGCAYRCAVWVQHRGCMGALTRHNVAEQGGPDQLAEWGASLSAASTAAGSAVRGNQQNRGSPDRNPETSPR